MDVHRSALVPYSAQQMFDLVNDIEAYSLFLPWCRSSEVLSQSDAEIRARVEIAAGPLNQSFVTRNSLIRGESIQMKLEKGPFSRLDGYWRFESLQAQGCKVSLELHFDFPNFMMRVTMTPMFNQIANTLVDAFVQRARIVYAEK